MVFKAKISQGDEAYDRYSHKGGTGQIAGGGIALPHERILP